MAREYDPILNGPLWENAIVRSHEYARNEINQRTYEIIDSYCANTDPDDWLSAPLAVSYQIINWATKKINKNNNAKKGLPVSSANYLPELLTPQGLEDSGLTAETLIEQVENAKILDTTLHSFPPLEENENITVYRGENCTSFYYRKAANMNIGDEMVILPFLSTSINQHVARRFTSKINKSRSCLWEIILSPGQILPYISDSVPEELGNENSAETSEQEVLLPTHARLRLVSKSVDEISKVYRFELVGFDEIEPDFWERTLDNLLSVLPSVNSSNSENRNSSNRSTKKQRVNGGKRRRKQSMKKRKNNSSRKGRK